ncbi:MAG: NAD-dependent epimerase/dehydratase family protein [Planctomycetes bacterium]|nr:NAD-dependent epimerase/dehydratase family protein [Planctomycetota bacterium]MCW8136328.1 NAD-dependent epimerase/dehydratase family protein [Planctomycetota bacterium]
MKVLVTGGAGFIGSRIVQRLLDAGARVTTCSRGNVEQPAPNTRHRSVDLRDPKATAEAVAGHEVVFHVAAKAGVWGPRREYFDINVQGTRNVLAACQQHGVKTLVYTSTPSVVFTRGGIDGGDESLPYPRTFLTPYAESKAIAEQEVLAADNVAGLRTVALRPHLVWGKGDPHLLPRVIARAEAGKLKQVGDGRNKVDITHVNDAADAHLLAWRRIDRAAGKAYFISSEAVALWPWINGVLQRAGVAPLNSRVSSGTAYKAGAVLEFIWRMLGKRTEPPMTRFVAENLATSHWFRLDAARRDLGYDPQWTGERALDEYFGVARRDAETQSEAVANATAQATA